MDVKNSINIAEYAYQEVSKIIKNDKKEFRSLARSYPSMLHKNGLSAATAFLYSKNQNSHKVYYQMIKRWIEIRAYSKEDLMKQIVNADNATYRLYTYEVMNLCLWIKRFAEGMIGDND